MQGLHALVGFEHHVLAHDRLLPQFVGAGDLFLPGTVVGLVALGLGGGLGRVRLGDLGADLRRIDDHQGVAFADHLALIREVRFDTARDLAGNPVFRRFRFALQQGFLGFRYQIAGDADCQNDCDQRTHSDQEVVILVCHNVYS